ncbi:hypothetical protein [Streptomyces mirabilis]|uniref:hypothetical protein n=1 Tax=Streptomyces mirabilis TaxID=68239 RepID=UPI0033E99D65
MVRNHARKDAARNRRREHPDENHRQAVEQVRKGGADARAERVVIVSFPVPELEGAEPCFSCKGTGLTGERQELPVPDPNPGDPAAQIVDELCTDCLGCGRAYHVDCESTCRYSSHPADDDRVLNAKEHRCSWCAGRRYAVMETTRGPRTSEERVAYDRLRQWAVEAGVDLWRIDEPILYGDFDHLMGDGATDLAWSTVATSYLRIPCRCADELRSTVRRSELEGTTST